MCVCVRLSESGQELSHCEEKLELVERSLNCTQDELSGKSSELERERQQTHKLSVELRSAREQLVTHEQELHDARAAIGRYATLYTPPTLLLPLAHPLLLIYSH